LSVAPVTSSFAPNQSARQYLTVPRPISTRHTGPQSRSAGDGTDWLPKPSPPVWRPNGLQDSGLHWAGAEGRGRGGGRSARRIPAAPWAKCSTGPVRICWNLCVTGGPSQREGGRARSLEPRYLPTQVPPVEPRSRQKMTRPFSFSSRIFLSLLPLPRRLRPRPFDTSVRRALRRRAYHDVDSRRPAASALPPSMPPSKNRRTLQRGWPVGLAAASCSSLLAHANVSCIQDHAHPRSSLVDVAARPPTAVYVVSSPFCSLWPRGRRIDDVYS